MNNMEYKDETRNCQNCKNDFIVEQEDFLFYEKMQVPPPTFCPNCRFQRRASFRNEDVLFRNKSAKSGKEIITLIPPESGLKVYDEPEWWSDDWDPTEYARDYDFDIPFFAQFFELMKDVPAWSRDVINMVNSDYSANAGYLKNCYLLFNSNYTEDSMYGNAIDHSRNCIDNSHVSHSEQCYGSFWLSKCYRTNFSIRSSECRDVWFSSDCKNCSDCFGCVNLTNKRYHFFNQSLTKEEYEAKLLSFKINTSEGLKNAKEVSETFWNRFPKKFIQGIKNENVTGEYVTNSKNVKNSYLVRQGKDLKYVQYLQVPKNEGCYDMTIWGDNNELGYENCVTGYNTSGLKFCFSCWGDVRDLEYSMRCGTSSNLFGCVGLRNKEYCILNKQYSKDQYFDMVEKIKKHMNERPFIDKLGRVYKYGEFFPIEFSLCGYNNTLAQEHFPLTIEETKYQGFKWVEPFRREYNITLHSFEIPVDTREVDKSILKEVLECTECNKPFRILDNELIFLKSLEIALPKSCPGCRSKNRLKYRNQSFLFKRRCDCGGKQSKNKIYNNEIFHFHGDNECQIEFETSYSPDRPEIVYCEKCYQQEVY